MYHNVDILIEILLLSVLLLEREFLLILWATSQ